MKKRAVYRYMAGIGTAICLLAGCGSAEKEYFNKAEEYLTKGDYGQALNYYKKAIMEDEELAEAYRGAGIACMEQGNYEEAEDMFQRALGETDGMISKDEIDAIYYLGETQICLGKFEEAVSNYSNLIEYDKNETEAYFYRGRVYLLLGDTKKAAEDFEKVAQKADARLLYGIFEAYQQAGMTEGESYLKKITSQKGDSAELLCIIGKAYIQLGDVEKGISNLKKSAEKGEDQAYFNLGQFYESQGDFASAMQNYETYQSKAKLTIGEYHVIIECMLKQGDYEGALTLNQELQKEGSLNKQDLQFEEIVICERGNDFSAAREKAQAYIEAYPDDEEGRKEYDFLQTR